MELSKSYKILKNLQKLGKTNFIRAFSGYNVSKKSFI